MAGITREAIAAIGAERPSDWRLEARGHAARLPPAAGALRRVLEGPEMAKLIATYEAADRAAGRAQATYRRWSRAAYLCRFLAISIGAVALLQLVGAMPKWLAGIGLGVEYGLIALSLVFAVLLSLRLPFEQWMEHRARAETARIDYFNRVCEAEEPSGPGELPLLPLQLEYFRRYHLDVQRLFYRERGLEHARGAGHTRAWRLATVALVVVAAIPASLGFLGAWAQPLLPPALARAAELVRGEVVHTLLLVLGIVATALADLVSAVSLVSLDQRNAARYLKNADNLDFLAGDYLEDARAAAAAGDARKVDDFISLVQSYISSEHREWMLARDLAQNLTLENFAQLRLPRRRR